MLKLDIEDGSAGGREGSQPVGARSNGSFLFAKGGDSAPWTTVQVANFRRVDPRWRDSSKQGSSVMKEILAFFFTRIQATFARRTNYHNDALRANQFNDPAPAFSFWRSLVS
ncbi:MAG: hypothetical protein JO324_09080 [Candidatus Eremiobacteraeota bacterium]|nr:hypothetical protein [Candidatus Eremiobacteraeota bacterium]